MGDFTAAIAVILFGAGFYQLNDALHRFAHISHSDLRSPYGEGDLPRDRWLGLAYLISLSPVMVVVLLREAPRAAASVLVAWPVAVVIVVGVWRGRQSASTFLFFGAHAGEIAFLWLANPIAPLKGCVASSASLERASFCAEQAGFWLGTFISVFIAFATIIAASIVVLYSVDAANWGWKAIPEERQVLALLYSATAGWMSLAGFLWLALPAYEVWRSAVTTH